jgi:glycosyltransferase involved in cell wall biosynthesis
VGGAERYLEGLIRYAAANAHVELICRRDPILDQWVRTMASDGIAVHRLDLSRPADYLRMFRLMRGADLVHLVMAYPVGKYQLVAALLARGARRPLVVTHELAIDIDQISMPSVRRAFWRFAFRRYGRLARVNIAVSRSNRELLVGRYGFPAASTRLIHNGADLRRFTSLEDAERAAVRRAIAAKLGGDPWPDDALLVCTVARLSVQKGLIDLLNAAAVVVPRDPRARFVIVGEGELRSQLKERILALQLGTVVRLAGGLPQSEVAKWLGASDLFVLPSHYEGLPFSLVEAMAAGCAVIATEVGGVRDVISDDRVGCIVPPRDAPALATAIADLLADAETRQRMGAAARARVLDGFDAESCYRRTVETYGT